jgi:hypothetical protein
MDILENSFHLTPFPPLTLYPYVYALEKSERSSFGNWSERNHEIRVVLLGSIGYRYFLATAIGSKKVEDTTEGQ